MDNPPPNYDPNQSLLEGGIEPITRVMGGGGLAVGGSQTPPDGYNETASVYDATLSAGSGANAVIEKVEGGGKQVGGNTKNPAPPPGTIVPATPEIIFIKNYVKSDATTVKKFINNLKKSISNSISKLENKYNILYRKPNTYNYNNMTGIYDSVNTQAASNKIYYIPSNTKELIILPDPTGQADPEEILFYQIQFLLDNKYLRISKTNKLILKKNIIVVSLLPLIGGVRTAQSDVVKYFQYRLKISNFNSVFFIDSDTSVVYPEKLKDATNDFPLIITADHNKIAGYEKSKIDILDSNVIRINNITSLSYINVNNTQINNTNAHIISSSQASKQQNNDPDNIFNFYDFSLEKNIAIIKLDNTYQEIISVDLQGSKYTLRLPRGQITNDKVYSAWSVWSFTSDEKRLLNKLNLPTSDKELKDAFTALTPPTDPNTPLYFKEVADFLYYLTYHKCFNDISLLTNNECAKMRRYLEEIYKLQIERNS